MTCIMIFRPFFAANILLLLLLLNVSLGTDTQQEDRFEQVIVGPDGYAADPCVPGENYDSGITNDGIEFVRTPDEAFADLAANGYPWSPNYVTIDGLRMHYLDVCGDSTDTCSDTTVGDREVVLLLHGQPTWSFLYRKMIPVLASRGFRIYAPDWIGFGRSDKPTDMAEHTYLKQVDRLKSFISQIIPSALEEPTINLFVQDWGSLIGLRVVADEPDWFKRVIVANGHLPAIPVNPFQNPNIVNYNCSDDRTALEMMMDRRASIPCGLDMTCFSMWIDFALTNPIWMPSELIRLASSSSSEEQLTEEELAMYDVAFVSRMYMAAPRAFPSMIAAVHEPEFGNIAAWEDLRNFNRPFLSLAGEDDPNLGSEAVQNQFIDNVPGASIHDFEHRRYPDAGHFIQEDAGEEVAQYVADFIDGTSHIFDDAVPAPPPAVAPSSGGQRFSLCSQAQFFALVMLLPHRLF